MNHTISIIDDPAILGDLDRLDVDCLDRVPTEELKRYLGALAFVLCHVEILLDLREDADSNRACRHCGCTDDRACEGGCYWVEPDLCSACDPEAVAK